MTRLSDKINEAVVSSYDGGALDRTLAVSKARALIDDDDRDILVEEALQVRVKTAATSAKNSLRSQATRRNQFALFPDLHRGYAIDHTGEQIKLTDALSRTEFKRVIAIRCLSIEADQKHLKALEDAEAAVAPLWDRYPFKSFGEICELYAERSAA
jgi:hypothetical protein